MSIPNVLQTDTFDQWRVKTNTIATNAGDLVNLNTVVKTNAVSAINEVKSNVGDLANLNTTNKTNIVNGINEVQSTGKAFSIAMSIALG